MSTGPKFEIDSAELDCIGEFRQRYGGSGGFGKRTVANASGTINGRDIDEIWAISGKGTAPHQTVKAGPDPMFKAISERRGELPRLEDAEFHLMDNLSRNLDPADRGIIRLNVDRSPCSSCSGVFDQFTQKFPNINLEIYYPEASSK